jgi:hypothetical protein
MGLADIFKTPINSTQIGVVMSLLEGNTSSIAEIVPNCLSAINAVTTFSDNVPENERVYYRCKACDKCVWVSKGMSALAEFPGCFKCQENWLGTLNRSSK